MLWRGDDDDGVEQSESWSDDVLWCKWQQQDEIRMRDRSSNDSMRLHVWVILLLLNSIFQFPLILTAIPYKRNI